MDNSPGRCLFFFAELQMIFKKIRNFEQSTEDIGLDRLVRLDGFDRLDRFERLDRLNVFGAITVE